MGLSTQKAPFELRAEVARFIAKETSLSKTVLVDVLAPTYAGPCHQRLMASW
jgi:hypothetical protein